MEQQTGQHSIQEMAIFGLNFDANQQEGAPVGTGYRYIPQKIALRLCKQHAGVRGLFFIRNGKLVGSGLNGFS